MFEAAFEWGAGAIGFWSGTAATVAGPVGKIVGHAMVADLKRRDLQIRRAELSPRSGVAVRRNEARLEIVRPAWPGQGIKVAHFLADDLGETPRLSLDGFERHAVSRPTVDLYLKTKAGAIDSEVGLYRLFYG